MIIHCEVLFQIPAACLQLFPVFPNLFGCVEVILGLINIFLPGVGVMIAACIDNNQQRFMHDFWSGMTEFWLTFIFIGFVFGVIHGIIMIIDGCMCNHERELINERRKIRQEQQVRVQQIQNFREDNNAHFL